MNIKEQYKNKIDELSSKTFSKDQKDLAKAMIDAAPEAEAGNWYQFIIQKVKLGFTFDAAPEVFQGAISLVKENKELGINLDKDFLEHKLIIGENYDALKNLLLIYRNKIDAIYIDPPYNTEKTKEDGNHLGVDANIKASSFIYRDKFSRTGWLNMMNERLKLAKELLSDDGVIFVSIDDNEQAYLKVLMDEVFGEENFVENLIWEKFHTIKANTKYFSNNHEYVLVYSKNYSELVINLLPRNEQQLSNYKNPDNDPRGVWQRGNLLSPKYTKSNDYIYKNNLGIEYMPKQGTSWRFSEQKMKELESEGRLKFEPNSIRRKIYLSETKDGVSPSTILKHAWVGHTQMGTEELKEIFDNKLFDFPKPSKLLKFIINLLDDKNALILDFFAGSGTTGHAVMELNEEDGGNRQFILVTNNENNIGKEITLNRLSNVITGESKNGTKTSWRYSKEKDFLSNNKVKVFELKKYSVSLNDNISELTKTASEELKNFSNGDYSSDEIDIIHDLNSLHPQKEEE